GPGQSGPRARSEPRRTDGSRARAGSIPRGATPELGARQRVADPLRNRQSRVNAILISELTEQGLTIQVGGGAPATAARSVGRWWPPPCARSSPSLTWPAHDGRCRPVSRQLGARLVPHASQPEVYPSFGRGEDGVLTRLCGNGDELTRLTRWHGRHRSS